MKKKTFALLLSLALVVGCVVGGTLAWLTAQTDPVKNTFTTSNIDITLNETTGNKYKMVPGLTIKKDPIVTVVEGSEPCYLFVKLEESINLAKSETENYKFGDFLEYHIASGWNKLEGVDGVYYRVVDKEEQGTKYSVLDGDKVTVLNTVTKDMMDTLKKANEDDYPTLTVTAYASQLMDDKEEFTAVQAWNNISSQSTNN